MTPPEPTPPLTGPTSLDIKLWDIQRLGDTTAGRYRVRWSVAGRERCRSFRTKALADRWLSDLKSAAHRGEPFEVTTGLPAETARARAAVSWYEHARAYAAMKWPRLAPNSRRSTAEALTTLTLALTAGRRQGAPDAATARRALMHHAFNPTTWNTTPPAPIALALEWIAAACLPVAALDNPATVRVVLDACTTTLAGAPASASTVARKRAVFANACGYALERGLLCTHPLARVQWRAPAVAETVDRRVVATPEQVRALLAAVAAQGDRGRQMEAFFGCLYYAALRPAEAVALRRQDCVLPETGWGRLDLAGSEPKAGSAWTDTGTPRQARVLKHRAARQTRPVPIPPELVALLRAHLTRFGTGPDGRLFRTRRGKPLQDTGYNRVWHAARRAALTPDQVASPLAGRPYDLRHAAVSLWLGAGVPATEVARRAGHSVAVLLKVYAGCLDGQHTTANGHIDGALNPGR